MSEAAAPSAGTAAGSPDLAAPSTPPAVSEPAGDLVTLDLVTRSLPRRSLFAKLIYQWMHQLTAGGRVVVIGAVLLTVAAGALTTQYPMYMLASALAAVFLVDFVIGWAFKPRVTIERRIPSRCAADAEVRVHAKVTNVGWLPAYDLAVRELCRTHPLVLDPDMEYVDRLGRGETRELVYVVHPTRRGSYDLPGPEALSTFPFGLYNTRRKTDQPHRLLVYPRFKPLVALRVPAGRRHQPGGLELVSQVGDSEEFVGLREYRTGDRLRDLHHLAWARVGFPVVREYNQEYLTRIAMVVDTYQPRFSLARTRGVEALISLGAAVADALAREEYVVDVFAAGPELYHFQAGRSLAFLDDILDVLACVEECRDDPFPKLGPALLDDLGQISTVFCLFLDWDETRASFVREIEARGSQAVVLIVREGETTLPPAATAGGQPKRFTPAEVEAGIDVL
jgi:uncharacterized protein (DUF58 family)